MLHKHVCCLKQFSYIFGVIQCKNKHNEHYNSYKGQTIYISSKKAQMYAKSQNSDAILLCRTV